MREEVHEIVYTPCRRFQLVTIDSVVFEVHERVARLRKARSERAQMGQDLSECRPR